MKNTVENNTTERRTFKETNTDFVQMLGVAFGSEEQPNFDKVQDVMELLTQLGYEKPVFIRKCFSPQMMGLVARVAPEFKGMNKMQFGLNAMGYLGEFMTTYENA